mmetsp:Transcript_8010/g.10188  ORF Transcript_8010/g.10188 Transcript_8010/m.10188 type:complete len:341 (+) Transcript_8010:37-1059(+)
MTNNGSREEGSGVKTGLFLVGNEQVKAFNDESFIRVRELYGLDESFLSSIDFGQMEAGGGKGGMMMGFSADKLYIVKELNKDDHRTMLKISKEIVDHILDEEIGSLLARVFAHFERKGHIYIVMNNWMPPPKYDKINADQKEKLIKASAMYDLKGCADDKTLSFRGEKVEAIHKRIFNIPLWLGKAFWSPERHHYHSGKMHARNVRFPVSETLFKQITAKIDRDVDFLQRYGLMDYSLVISYHVVPNNPTLINAVFTATSDRGSQPYISVKDNQAFILYVGLIDYLQDYGAAKVVANCIKVAERNKATIPPQPYGDRFALFCKHKFYKNNCQDYESTLTS